MDPTERHRVERQRFTDERDVAILGLAAAGLSECEIARQLRCRRRTVRRVIADDARAFPAEPLIPPMLQPGGMA